MTTAASFTALGSGQVEFRLVIEGCPFEFVTTEAMAGMCPSGGVEESRQRVNGLRRSGLELTEEVTLVDSKLRATAGNAQVVNVGGYGDFAFTQLTETVGALSSMCLYSDSTMAVANANNIAVGDIIHVNTEAMLVTAKAGTTLTVRRGMWGTIAQTHYLTTVASANASALAVTITKHPITYRGRRAWIYAHGDEEFATSAQGQIVWRGTIGSTPTSDSGATIWRIPLASLTELFDQEIGSATSDIKPRGIYIPAADPIYFRFDVNNGPNATSAFLSRIEFLVCGFWSTQAEFCSFLTLGPFLTLLASAGHGQFIAEERGDTWTIRAVTDGTTPRYVYVVVISEVERAFAGGPMTTGAQSTPATTVTAATTYEWPPQIVSNNPNHSLAGLSTVPRCSVLSWSEPPQGLPFFGPGLSSSGVDFATADAAFPRRRLYLTTVAPFVADGVVALRRGSGETARVYRMQTTTVNTTDSWVEMFGGMGAGYIRQDFVSDDAPSIDAVAKVVEGGSFKSFLDAVITAGPAACNGGNWPLLTPGDVDTGGLAPVIATKGAALQNRAYAFGKTVKLSEIVEAECRLLGVFPVVQADGRIGFVELVIDVLPQASVTRTMADIGAVVIDNDGLVSSVSIATGYDVKDDKHTGDTFNVRWSQTANRARKANDSKIEPKSRPIGPEITEREAMQIAYPVLELFGNQRIYVTVPVTIDVGAVCPVGTLVAISVANLPFAGERARDGAAGITARTGRVVRRTRSLSEAHATLTVLLRPVESPLYSPTMRVVSGSTSDGGKTWALTVASSYHRGAPLVDSELFAVGDRVRIREWDAAAPATYVGVIASVGGTSVTIALDGTLASLGSASWDIIYAPATDSGLALTQKRYVAIGGADVTVAYATGSKMAVEFAS